MHFFIKNNCITISMCVMQMTMENKNRQMAMSIYMEYWLKEWQRDAK